MNCKLLIKMASVYKLKDIIDNYSNFQRTKSTRIFLVRSLDYLTTKKNNNKLQLGVSTYLLFSFCVYIVYILSHVKCLNKQTMKVCTRITRLKSTR